MCDRSTQQIITLMKCSMITSNSIKLKKPRCNVGESLVVLPSLPQGMKGYSKNDSFDYRMGHKCRTRSVRSRGEGDRVVEFNRRQDLRFRERPEPQCVSNECVTFDESLLTTLSPRNSSECLKERRPEEHPVLFTSAILTSQNTLFMSYLAQ